MKTPLLNHKREGASGRAKWGVALVFIFLIGAMFAFSSQSISETKVGETDINVLKKVCLMFAGEKYCASKADIGGMDQKPSLRYEMVGHGPCVTDGRILMSQVEGGVEKCMAKCDSNDECRAITFVQGDQNFNCECILGTYKLSQEPDDSEADSICFEKVKSSSEDMEGVEGDEARVLVTEEFSDGEGPPSPEVMEHLKSVVTEIFEDGGLNDPPKPEPEPKSPLDIHHILKSPPSPVITPPEPIEEIIPSMLSSILDSEPDSEPELDSEPDSEPMLIHIRSMNPPPPSSPHEPIIHPMLSAMLPLPELDSEPDSEPDRIHIRSMDPPPPSSPLQPIIPPMLSKILPLSEQLDSEPDSEPVRIHIGSIDPPPHSSPMVGGIGGIGPAWTYDKSVEKPAETKDMGGWTARVYSQEQQDRLGVDANGKPKSGMNGVKSILHPMLPPILPIPEPVSEHEPMHIVHLKSMDLTPPEPEPMHIVHLKSMDSTPPEPEPMHIVHVQSMDPTPPEPPTILHHMQVIKPPPPPPQPPKVIHQTHVIPPEDPSDPLHVVHKTHIIQPPPPEPEPMKVIHHTQIIHPLPRPEPIHMIHLVETQPPKSKPPQVVHVIHAEPPPPPVKPHFATIQTRGDTSQSSGSDNGGDKTTTTTPALGKKGKYEKKDSGKTCNKGRIATEKECESASKELGHKFSGVIDDEKKPPGCNYNGGEIRFNKNAKATGSDDSYDEICIV